MVNSTLSEQVNDLKQSKSNLTNLVLGIKVGVSAVLDETKIDVSDGVDKYKIISAKEALDNLQITQEVILEGAQKAIASTQWGYHNVSGVAASDIYAAVYLHKNGVPLSYIGFKELKKGLSVDSTLYKACLEKQAHYLTKENFSDFFRSMSYAFHNAIYNHEEETVESIIQILKNTPATVKNEVIEYLRISKDNFESKVLGCLSVQAIR